MVTDDMVLQRRLDYGFNGYQVPPTPRATRSVRRRSSVKKKTDDNPMCAFDLLATVAGKLLVEGENSPCSIETLTGEEHSRFPKESVKKEQLAEDNNNNNPSKLRPGYQGSCNRTFFVSEIVTQAPVLDHGVNDASSGFASALTYSDCSEKVGSGSKLVENGIFATKVDVGLSGSRALFGCNLEDGNKTRIKIEPPNTGKVPNGVDNCSSEENSVKLTSGDHSPRGSFPFSWDDVKLVRDDDDENSSGCTQPSTLNKKAFSPPLRVGDHRIKKILASKYWKVAPKLKDEEHFSTVSPDAETKTVYRNRNNCYKRQRSLRDYPFKKRKLFDHGLESNSDGGVSSDAISSSPGKGSSVDAAHGATGPSAFGAVQHASSFQPKDSHVKLKIKSFRVPELFIEIPETATVGSLKRTVLEAVTAILSGGLRVGVLLQGKKIRDDNKTLVQTGISHDNKLEALGFTLEPNPSQVPHHLCPEEHPFLLPCENPKPLTRYPPAPNVVQKIVQQGNLNASPDSHLKIFGNLIESDHDSAPSPPYVSVEKSTKDSRALVPVPAPKMESLAVVPVRKSKRSDVAQRRIRRPFSVSEVEALVQAVEKLGTGRWRDVKLRAFDNAKHRTYVDLKDKWKTLVHTARISPQQRRGEPVPQELLDRVLTAHAYWSQQQAKQQIKQQSEACLLL